MGCLDVNLTDSQPTHIRNKINFANKSDLSKWEYTCFAIDYFIDVINHIS